MIESHSVIARYCLQALLFDKEDTALMMERVVRPSIFMLASRLRDAPGWVDAESCTVTEKVLIRDAVRSITDVLVRLSPRPPDALF